MSAKKRSNPYLRAIVISVMLFVFLFIIGLSAKSFVSSPIEASDGDSPVFGSVIFNEMLLSNDNFYPDGNGGRLHRIQKHDILYDRSFGLVCR